MQLLQCLFVYIENVRGHKKSYPNVCPRVLKDGKIKGGLTKIPNFQTIQILSWTNCEKNGIVINSSF